MTIARLALIGAGHIGASIARAAALKAPEIAVTLYDESSDVRARAGAIGLGAIAASAADALRGADLAILCVPVGAMAAAGREAMAHLKPGAILSDVGSVKSAVIAAIAPRADIFFVPAHPLAGTEHSGPESGLARLFENRWALITPLDDPRADYVEAVAALSAFWARLGANVETMAPARHDVVLSVVSHLPHLIAYNIVAMAEDMETISESEVVKYSASGFRDFTRIASSDPTMWRDVFLNNREAVLETLGRFTEDLAALQRAIRGGDGQALFDLFTRARRVRREVIEAGQDSAVANFGRDKG